MSDEPLIAVFIDYENLALGVQDMTPKHKAVEIELVLKRLLEKGRIVYKRAYCDWGRYRDATKKLHQHGVTMVDIPHSGVSGKNSADIHMVVDAMDLCNSKEHISLFALLSGDSDFSPLVHKLKECDKRVVGCGVKSSTSNLLVASCDEFIYYDDLVRKRAEKKPRERDEQRPAEDKKDEAYELVMEIIRSLAQDYENVWASMVKQTMGRVYPGFNHEHYGFRTFGGLLLEAVTRGGIEMVREKGRGNQLIHLKEGS